MVSEAPTESEAVSKRVVAALARAAGTDPRTLDPPLYTVIDPEALDTLVESTATTYVEFEHDGRRIVVHADGTVTVDGTSYDGGEVAIEA
ncbi:HalOD1 output domain-containing protein [Halostella salina]|uniref:HalOD1 output domain-containing protein n=1 Tax=Halostella salina TaxID=1547897 RepID=UPI000EF7E9F6|nr:HalOD1 output domain-containing protein [Halostella salina]